MYPPLIKTNSTSKQRIKNNYQLLNKRKCDLHLDKHQRKIAYLKQIYILYTYISSKRHTPWPWLIFIS